MNRPESLTGIAGCLALILIALLAAGVWFCITGSIAYLAVWVFSGFNVSIPFWPTFGAVVLIQMVLGLISRKVS